MHGDAIFGAVGPIVWFPVGPVRVGDRGTVRPPELHLGPSVGEAYPELGVVCHNCK